MSRPGPTWEPQWPSLERCGSREPLRSAAPASEPQEEALLGQRELRQNQNKAQQAGSGRVLGSRVETARPGAGRQAGAWLRSPRLQGCPEPSASTSPRVESGQIFCPSRWGNRKFYLLSHLDSTCFARPHSPTLPSPWASGFQSNLIIALFCSHTFFHGSPLLSLQNF